MLANSSSEEKVIGKRGRSELKESLAGLQGLHLYFPLQSSRQKVRFVYCAPTEYL